MRPLRVFVCEDDEVSLAINRVILEDYLKKNQIKSKISYCYNYKEQDEEFLKDIELAILDIDLEGSIVNGIELAKKIRELNPGTVFIFITGHEEFAFEATQIHLSGFLAKPVNQYDLQDTLRRSIKQVNGHRLTNMNHNIAKFNNGKIVLKERSIISIEKLANTHEVEIVTTEKKIQAYDSIRDIEKRLSSNFVKLNRSVIVNLSYIFNIESNAVNMRGGITYEISARNQKRVKKTYEEYIEKKLV